MSVGIELAKQFEGLHRVVQRSPSFLVSPYVCPAGFWTIGYGHLCKSDHPMITSEEAEEYLRQDLELATRQTLHLCPVLAFEPEHRLASIVDFTFNLGSGRLKASTLRRVLNDQLWGRVPAELSKWVYGGGRKLPGLILRRAAEIRLFTTGLADPSD